jgi:hypothetical protein
MFEEAFGDYIREMQNRGALGGGVVIEQVRV